MRYAGKRKRFNVKRPYTYTQAIILYNIILITVVPEMLSSVFIRKHSRFYSVKSKCFEYVVVLLSIEYIIYMYTEYIIVYSSKLTGYNAAGVVFFSPKI